MPRTVLSLRALTALAAASLSLFLPASGAHASAPQTAAPGDQLTSAVTAATLRRAAAGSTIGRADLRNIRVSTLRLAGDQWAFGTTIVAAGRRAGAYPDGWLFLARHNGSGWAVALEGDAAFADLSRHAPLLTADERPALAALGAAEPTTQAGGDFRTGMQLPWAVGQTWIYTGGPHGGARQSVDLAGGDEAVRAARGGSAYTMCKGWVRVVHDRGYATDYYHLWNNINVNGAAVSAGTFLGYTGTDVTCGGSATGRHVHFSLRQNGAFVGIQGHSFGKWQFYNGAAEYQGYALHGSTNRGAGGGAMYNYGALGFTQGVVDTNGGGNLNRRAGPGTNHAVVGTIPDGATADVACSANGTTHTGRFNFTTAMWNRLTDGSWVSDAYLWTGTGNPVNGWC